MKKCSKCDIVKEISGFHRRSSSPDGYQAMCSSCKNQLDRDLYKEDGTKKRQDNKVRGKEVRTADRKYLDQLKQRPCADCKIEYQPCQMDFDHLPGFRKLKDVALLVGGSREVLEAEIAKCEIVCSNCHRLRTHIRKLNMPP